MKIIVMSIILEILFAAQIYTQTQDTIIYNPVTKNYQVFYSTKMMYAQSVNGSLRRLNLDDILEQNETLVEKDTLVSDIFIPGTKIIPKVHCLVFNNQNNDSFYYEYTIDNGISAEQPLDYFIVEFGNDVRVAAKTINTWRNQQRYKMGTHQLDNKWAWSRGGDTTSINEILPGKKLGGFGISSSSIPGVYTAFFQGTTNYLNDFSFNISHSPISNKLFDLAFGYDNFVTSKTVAPSNALLNVGDIEGLDKVLSYSHESVDLNWLKSTCDNDCDSDERPDAGVAGNLEKYLQKIRSRLSDGDTLKALRELNKFIKKVERIYKRSEEASAKGKSDDVAMTSEAYALLKYNAQYLAERLVALPPRSNGTILQQIDSLKIEIQKQGKDKKLGGSILIKSLTLLCDQARRELQKADSSEAALNIALLQLVIDETREITEKLEEKQKKTGLLYVTADAYIALHYRTQYILDALPEPRMNLLSERKELLDPELKKDFEIMKNIEQ